MPLPTALPALSGLPVFACQFARGESHSMMLAFRRGPLSSLALSSPHCMFMALTALDLMDRYTNKYPIFRMSLLSWSGSLESLSCRG